MISVDFIQGFWSKGMISESTSSQVSSSSENFSDLFPFQKYKLEQVDNLKFLWIEFSGFTAAAMVSQLAFSRTSPTVGQLNINGFEQFFEYPTCPTYAVHQSYRNGAADLKRIIDEHGGRDKVVIFIKNPRMRKELPPGQGVKADETLVRRLSERFGENNVILA